MMDALKPYLKAQRYDIQLFSLRALVTIIIGETFGSDENSSYSQNMAHNWQLVVKKVTGLFSKEVTDLNGIEWKDKDEVYNTHVINFLKLMNIVLGELGDHDVPLVYIYQYKKDIARTVIDGNIVGKICSAFTDLHQHTLVITDDERNEIVSSELQSILWNYTDSSVEFAEQVANVPGFLEFVIDKLASESGDHLQARKEVILYNIYQY